MGFYFGGNAKPLKGLTREMTQPDLHYNRMPLTAVLRIDCGEQTLEEEVNQEAVGVD